MSKNNRLSHSAVNKFMTCARSYQFHYLDKLRPTVTHAALLFGSSVDAALGAMLEDHKRGDIDWLGQKYEGVFIRSWREGKINNKVVSLFDNPDIVYAAADMDYKLFNDKDFGQILTAFQNIYGIALTARTGADIVQVYEEMLESKEKNGWENLPENIRKAYNYMNWLCLVKKGQLMIKAYLEQVIPKIKNVLAIQKEVSIQSDSGDSIVGFIDLIAEWEDGKVYVLDNKTAARDYEWHAVLKSTQLALYVYAVEHEYNTRNAGFIVLGKAIDKDITKTCGACSKDLTGSRVKTCDAEVDGGKKAKRCGGDILEVTNPKAKVQILLGEIPPRVDELVLENMMDVNAAIKTGIFPRNLSACEKPFPCAYRHLCWAGKMDGLTKEGDGR
jgi:hypothetical protein